MLDKEDNTFDQELEKAREGITYLCAAYQITSDAILSLLSEELLSKLDDKLSKILREQLEQMREDKIKVQRAGHSALGSLASPPVTIAVGGTTNSGKTTSLDAFINSMVLPHVHREMSAGVTRVQSCPSHLTPTHLEYWLSGYSPSILPKSFSGNDIEVNAKLFEIMNDHHKKCSTARENNVAPPPPPEFRVYLNISLPEELHMPGLGNPQIKFIDLAGVANIQDIDNQNLIRQECRRGISVIVIDGSNVASHTDFDIVVDEVIALLEELQETKPSRIVFALNHADALLKGQNAEANSKEYVQDIKDKICSRFKNHGQTTFNQDTIVLVLTNALAALTSRQLSTIPDEEYNTKHWQKTIHDASGSMVDYESALISKIELEIIKEARKTGEDIDDASVTVRAINKSHTDMTQLLWESSNFGELCSAIVASVTTNRYDIVLKPVLLEFLNAVTVPFQQVQVLASGCMAGGESVKQILLKNFNDSRKCLVEIREAMGSALLSVFQPISKAIPTYDEDQVSLLSTSQVNDIIEQYAAAMNSARLSLESLGIKIYGYKQLDGGFEALFEWNRNFKRDINDVISFVYNLILGKEDVSTVGFQFLSQETKASLRQKVNTLNTKAKSVRQFDVHWPGPEIYPVTWQVDPRKSEHRTYLKEFEVALHSLDTSLALAVNEAAAKSVERSVSNIQIDLKRLYQFHLGSLSKAAGEIVEEIGVSIPDEGTFPELPSVPFNYKFTSISPLKEQSVTSLLKEAEDLEVSVAELSGFAKFKANLAVQSLRRRAKAEIRFNKIVHGSDVMIKTEIPSAFVLRETWLQIGSAKYFEAISAIHTGLIEKHLGAFLQNVNIKQDEVLDNFSQYLQFVHDSKNAELKPQLAQWKRLGQQCSDIKTKAVKLHPNYGKMHSDMAHQPYNIFGGEEFTEEDCRNVKTKFGLSDDNV